MHPAKMNNILALAGEERYGYFVKRVADFEEVWLIKDGDKYVTVSDKTEQPTIPLWPEKEFAERFLAGDWKNCTIEEMVLNDFMEWLDELESDKIRIACFPNQDLQAVVVEAKEMKNHILHELTQYE